MKPIVCPIDFSNTSDNALNYAAQFAVRVDSYVILAHVLHVPAVDVYSPANVLSSMMDTQRETTEKRLANLCEELQSEHKCKFNYRVEFGFAADVIAEIAEKEGAMMICMGTNGRSAVISRFLGSVSYETSKRSHCPVLVIPEKAEYRRIKKITVAYDHKDKIQEELSELHALFGHYAYDTDVITVSANGSGSYKCSIKNEEGGFRTLEIEDSSAASGICHYLKNSVTGLLVLKRHQRNFIENLLHKSTIKQVIGDSNTPMLILN